MQEFPPPIDKPCQKAGKTLPALNSSHLFQISMCDLFFPEIHLQIDVPEQKQLIVNYNITQIILNQQAF